MFISDKQWADVCPLLPIYKQSPKGGRPRLDRRKILEGIMYVSKNKIPWKEVPKVYGSGTALNDYFREWAREGVFHKIREHHWSIVICFDWDKIRSLRRFSLPDSIQASGHPPQFTLEDKL